MTPSPCIRQILLYLVVGAGATVVEWGVFYLLDVRCGVHYTAATALAFAVSTLANWGLGRLLIFSKGDAKGIVHELVSIYGISCLGLAANLGIMFVCITLLGFPDMLSKIIATAIVFAANFAVRKFFIYKV